MTDDRFDPSHGRGTQLVLHRPAVLTPGALRRIHVHLDGQHITALARDDTAHVSTTEGPHQLSGRCPPLISGERTFILAPRKSCTSTSTSMPSKKSRSASTNRPRPSCTAHGGWVRGDA